MTLRSLALILAVGGAGTAVTLVEPWKNSAPAPSEVATQTLTVGDLVVAVTAPGKLFPTLTRELKISKLFQIKKLLVSTGAKVAQGQAVAVLAHSQVLEDILGKVRGAEVDYQSAVKDHALAKELFEAKAIPENDVRDKDVRMQKARIQYQTAQDEFDISASLLGVDAGSVRKGPPFTLRAPIAGFVTKLNGEEGRWLEGDAKTPLMVIADLSKLRIIAKVNIVDVPQLRLGQRVEFTLAGFTPLQGKITSIALEPPAQSEQRDAVMGGQDNANTVEVGAEAEAPASGNVTLGVNGETRVIITERRRVPLIPVDAVVTRNGGKVVYVLDQGAARERPVVLGLRDDMQVEVVSGLQPDARIITQGHLNLRDGAPVRIKGTGAPALAAPSPLADPLSHSSFLPGI